MFSGPYENKRTTPKANFIYLVCGEEFISRYQSKVTIPIAFGLAMNPLLYVYFLNVNLFLKDLKSTLSSSVAIIFVASLLRRFSYLLI